MARFAFGITLFIALSLLSISAEAGPASGAFDAELARAREAGIKAQGPQKYVALRALAALWDQSDPDQVERAVVFATEASSTSPAAAVYGQILLAEARSRRGDATGAAARMAALGFIDRWLFVGPFDDQNRVGLAAAYQPETELSQAIVPGRVYDGKERPVRWRAQSPNVGGVIFDFGDWLRPRDQICGYVTSIVRAKDGTRAPRPISLWVGAEGAFKLWFNGQLLLEDGAYRGFDFDRFSARAQLLPGQNRITVKVCGDVRSPQLAVRIGDERGAPDLGVEVSNDPAATEKVVSAPKGAALEKNGDGPIQAFERLVASKSPSAANMENYARYLRFTGGNPRGEHRSRDLAARAAEAQPTALRALLAADLAEDKNQARVLVDRAESLLKKGDTAEQVSVLLSRARLARTGINWRDAPPFYEKALEIDPDNAMAVLGRTELYVLSGLPRTALAVLEKAVQRRPHSVALLRVYAAQLRGLGREAEADDIDARWFAFHANDSAFIGRQLERAISRGQPVEVERWATRFERSESDKVFAKVVVARALRSIGKQQQAKKALESALDIAPEEASTLRVLADLAGEANNRDEQLRYLRKILQLYPQDKNVRAYVEFLAPSKPKRDEGYAWDKDRAMAEAQKPPEKGERTRILHKLAVTTVFQNGLASRFHQIVFQPLTDEAAAEARQFFLQYEADRQEVELRLSRVYRKDGTVAEAIESGEVAANNPAIAMYTSVRMFAVSFPRLSPGDVVELRYRIDDVSTRNEVADAFYDVEYIQERDPVADAEYVLIAPKSRALSTFTHNLAATPEIKEDGDQKIYRYSVKNLPGLPPEPAQAPTSEIVGQIHVSTFKTWDEVGKWYWALAKDQLDVDDTVKKKLGEITKTAKTDADKVRAVYHYATSLRYVALEFGLEGIKPRRCALTMARGWGDCKDKATVIVTMLRELGIPSTLVLVRTGMRGDLPKDAPPSLGVFDHAIAYVPSLDLYLDGTAEGTGSTHLPAMNRGSVALQINEGNAKLVRLPNASPESSPHNRKISVAVSQDGSAAFSIDTSVAGVNASAWRGRYQPEGTRRERAAQDLTTFFSSVELGKDSGSLVVREVDDVEKPFGLSARGKAPAYARREGDVLSMPTASSLQLMTSVASLSSRKTDLILGALSLSSEERVTTFPASATVVRAPTSGQVDSPFGSVNVEVKKESGRLTVTSKFHLSKSRVTPAEYKAFREFCEKVDAALEQRLVLRF